MNIEYYLANPAGNITALVTSRVEKRDYKYVTEKIMQKHKDVEQVGFVSFEKNSVKLNMSGDEFCGNAAMSAAALYYKILKNCSAFKTRVFVFGTEKPVEVEVNKSDNGFECECKLSKPNSIDEIEFEVSGQRYRFLLVCFDGIMHIIADETLSEKSAESIIRELADRLSAKALGIMIFNKDKACVKPLVYVKDVDTLFFENSCASGSCAVAAVYGEGSDISLIQPGGNIRAVNSGDIYLFGNVKLSECCLEEF